MPAFKDYPADYSQSQLFPDNVFDLLPDDHDCFVYRDLFEQLDTSEVDARYTVGRCEFDASPSTRGIADPAHRTDFNACRGAGGRPRACRVARGSGDRASHLGRPARSIRCAWPLPSRGQSAH